MMTADWDYSLLAREADHLRSIAGPLHHAHTDERIIEQGHAATTVAWINDGWAIRSHDLDDGKRQITDFVLPGDFCDPCVMFAEIADFSVTVISEVSYLKLSRDAILSRIRERPTIAMLLWWDEAREAARLRAHMALVGRQCAHDRVKNLLLEVWHRLRVMNRATHQGFSSPITQQLIADASGLTAVHVSRVLGRLHREGILTFDRGTVSFHDPDTAARQAQALDPLSRPLGESAAPTGLGLARVPRQRGQQRRKTVRG